MADPQDTRKFFLCQISTADMANPTTDDHKIDGTVAQGGVSLICCLMHLTGTHDKGGQTPYSWSLATGSNPLPAGLNLSTAGVISGTPTTAGSFTPTVMVTDATTPTHLTSTKQVTIAITASLQITTVSPLPGGVIGTNYSQTLAATAGQTPYSWSLATGSNPLPAGLNLSTAGVISGTPTTAGSFTPTVIVTDATTPTHLTNTEQLTISVTAPLSITTSSTLPSGVVGILYSQSLAPTGGQAPYTWSIVTGSGLLPTGLSLSATTGAITGTPTAANTFGFTVQVTDSSSPILTYTKAFSITIVAPLTISPTSLPPGTVNTPYSATFTAAGGQPPYSWPNIGPGTAPTGLTFSNGVLSGTPIATGTFTFTVNVQDSSTPTPLTASQQYTVVIGGMTLQGSVLNGVGGTVMSDVTITLNGSMTKSTNSNGQFAFTNLPPGNYSITASYSGYQFSTDIDGSLSPLTANTWVYFFGYPGSGSIVMNTSYGNGNSEQIQFFIPSNSPSTYPETQILIGSTANSTANSCYLDWSNSGNNPNSLNLATDGGTYGTWADSQFTLYALGSGQQATGKPLEFEINNSQCLVDMSTSYYLPYNGTTNDLEGTLAMYFFPSTFGGQQQVWVLFGNGPWVNLAKTNSPEPGGGITVPNPATTDANVTVTYPANGGNVTANTPFNITGTVSWTGSAGGIGVYVDGIMPYQQYLSNTGSTFSFQTSLSPGTHTLAVATVQPSTLYSGDYVLGTVVALTVTAK